jgi:hypothetical protein
MDDQDEGAGEGMITFQGLSWRVGAALAVLATVVPGGPAASPGSPLASGWSTSAPGQDAGLLFLQPVLDALTYGADVGLDVINMSFYVDPWLYNCANSPSIRPRPGSSSAPSSRR